jgi:hypothetical protein
MFIKIKQEKKKFQSLPSKFRSGTAGTVPKKILKKKIQNVKKHFDKKKIQKSE